MNLVSNNLKIFIVSSQDLNVTFNDTETSETYVFRDAGKIVLNKNFELLRFLYLSLMLILEECFILIHWWTTTDESVNNFCKSHFKN